MNFFANIPWVGIGLAFLSLARSYIRIGPRAVGITLNVLGVIVLAAARSSDDPVKKRAPRFLGAAITVGIARACNRSRLSARDESRADISERRVERLLLPPKLNLDSPLSARFA